MVTPAGPGLVEVLVVHPVQFAVIAETLDGVTDDRREVPRVVLLEREVVGQ